MNSPSYTVPPVLLAVCSDLSVELPQAERLQRLVQALRNRFHCGAVALLKLEEERLRPLAVSGLVSDALGRRFVLSQHPRLATILARHEVVSFAHDSDLPDPYDGLLDSQVGVPLPVHDCMGVSLHLHGQPWGVLTLDAMEPGTFGSEAHQRLAQCVPLAEAVVRVAQLEQELQQLRRQDKAALAYAPNAQGMSAVAHEGDAEALEIVGDSAPLQQLLHEVEVVAASELPVLLLGETGVGKELFARLLHQRSVRRHRPLVHVNCAALPESLAESELFGHVRGAFSGAVSNRPGRFEAAEGGTLFLDEVGELPLSVQAKLLRTLQNGEIQRLGTDRPRRVQVRVIAATNRNLREQVASGAFRTDLYHRLSVYPVPIPPLSERGNDVLLLAGRFLELNRARLGLRSLRLAPDAREALLHYPWPGNVRELEHVISRAALKALSRGAQRSDIVTLQASWLDLDGVAPLLTPSAEPVPTQAHPQAAISLQDAVQACQRQVLQAALTAHAGNWAQAARQLQVDASNLHKLARRLGLKG